MTEDGRLNLKQVALALDVHYMTAYRYVRRGLLPASRVGSNWVVDSTEVDAFRRRADSHGERPAEHPGRVDWVGRLHARLVECDEAGAWTVVQDALVAGWTADDVLVDLLAPAVARTSPEDGSHAGHLVATTAQRTAAVLSSQFRRRGRHRGTVVLGTPVGEGHSLALALITDLLRIRNVAVLELGDGVPAEAFVDAARRAGRLVAVAIGVTGIARLDQARDVVLALRDHVPGVPILLGGQAVRDRGVAELAGADAWAPDVRGVARLVEDLITERRGQKSSCAAASVTPPS